ncbi:hypothetical protein KC19_2G282600 [Ceratodon purpureus]|uniref:AAA+ ATPase domain-containing protein n=1 Tax=Ceratodon purpureus TaxID=3225 RepID=A0A8T0J1A3_CERPU|nr:hypothetical protein KC19_2G282600 [Ceratodon purpureus]
MGDRQRFGQSPYGDTEATTEDVVQTRALLDVSASTGDVKEWMNNFFLNQAYGAFCMNILADIFVRLCFFVCTYLALLRCWRAKEREIRLTDLQIQQCLDNYSDSQKRTFETYFRSESFIRRVSQAATPGAQSSVASASSVLDSQVQANTSGEQLSSIPIVQGSNAGLSPACAPVMNSTNALPTVSEKVVESAADQKKGLEQLPKRRNGYVHDCHFPDESRSSEITSSSSGEISSSHSQKNVPTQARDDVVIDIPAICVFPTSASMEKGNKLKHFFRVRVGVSCDHDISSSRILQARVRATEENLSALRDVAVEGMKLDEGFTLQIGESVLYYCDGNPEEPALLSLRDVEVPTVLQADYSVGVLTIRGRYLEGAEIRAATFDGYMILNFTKQDQIHSHITPPERRLEVWRCTDLLPPVNLDRIHICASKAVPIEGHDVTVRSEVCSIQNTTLRTVIRTWVPTAILIMFLTSQAWILFALILNLVMDSLQPSRNWLISYPVLIALALYIIQELPQSLEDNMKAFMEQFKLAISSFQMVPDLFSSPPFRMRNGYCFHRGAKYLFDSQFILGGRYYKGSLDRKGTLPFERSRYPRRSPDEEEESPHSSKSDVEPEIPVNPPTSKDWKWPCLRGEYDKKTNTYATKRFDPDSKQESHDISDPFTVTYSELSKPRATDFGREVRLQYIPQNVSVKLYSKHLQAVVKDLLPSKLKLFENYGEIQASDLLELYFGKLLGKGCKEMEADREANDFLTSNDKFEGECLDMFHLIRFLRKEYEETIIQYERMMEADVISWDMLWTLIVPKADVVYYCTISKEEMCGKVLSTCYTIRQITSEKSDEFVVDLEVYDYNCINFEAKKIKCVILPFKGEAKVSDIDVCPLQRRADSHRLKEFFLMRGRKFYDLVLKYERRFMQYQGVLYNSLASQQPIYPRGGSMSSSRSMQSWSIGYKENIDGRVMIDQLSFVKMNLNDDMATAEPSRGWSLGNGSKSMETVIDEIDPQLLKYAPAVAYGYSFSVGKWGCFTIEGFTEIQFISTAFDTLVMNEDIKNTLLTLTEHHIKHPLGYGNGVARNADPLPNKGKGCIILLHGAPGTGKTLTVESLAEKLECPLWQLCVSKISKTIRELETDLLKTFQIAATWRAILVLDEADVYLSSRKYSPLSSNVTETNAMTGVFLRVLEYYTGILFLTTNVIHSIEPAIYSRMSLFVKYEEFNIEDRKQLWINFLNRVGFQHPSQEFWDKVLPEKFNGRVIRNIIQNAQILAGSTGSLLSEDELLKACRVMATPYTTSQSTELKDNPDPISTHASTSWKISDQQSLLAKPSSPTPNRTGPVAFYWSRSTF